MSVKIKTARFFKETGPRSLFRAFRNGDFCGFWTGDGLIVRRAVKKIVSRLSMSHRKRIEDFVPGEWSALAIDLRLDGVSPVGLYLETVTDDGPLCMKVGANTAWNGRHSIIYVTDSKGLSDEILGMDAVTSGAFYEYVRDSWGTGNQYAMWQKYRERILKEDPAHYCVDVTGRSSY